MLSLADTDQCQFSILPKVVFSDMPPTHSGNLYNLNALRDIPNSNPAFVERMVALFMDEARTVIATLGAAYTAKDWPVMKACAHRFKTAVNNLAIESIRADLQAIEHFTEGSSSLEETEQRIRHIESVLTAVLEDLQKNQAGQPPH